MSLRLSVRALPGLLACLAVVVALVLAPHLLGHLSSALSALRGATPGWLAAAAAGYAVAYLTAVGAWRTAIHAAGGKAGFGAVLARLGIGSVVNTLAPARLGDAVKVALLSDAFEGTDRVWTTGGLYAAVAASRAYSIAALVVAASLAGALPLWPALALVGGAAALLAVGLSPLPQRFHRLAHLLAGLGALAHSPRRAAALVAWSAGTTASRLAATTALAAAFGFGQPVVAGLVIVTAIDVAGALPLTPGNIGVAGGAVAVALASRGIGANQAMGAGFAIQALETLVSLGAGTVGVLHFAGSGRVSPWLLRAATVAMAIALTAAGAAVAVVLA